MYLALFVIPWMLLYSLSSLAMNHVASFKRYYGGQVVNWQKEQERNLAMQFSSDATTRFMAEQILRDLQLEGNYNVDASKDGKVLTILRIDPITPRRITYRRLEGRLLIEKQEFRVQPFLSELHRRRGYQSSFVIDDLWAAAVDLAIVAILFWVLSGIWLWWELKVTRRLGLLCALSGIALYVVFVVSI